MAKDMRVVALSLIGLFSVVLAFMIHWTFLGVAALTQLIGWRLLMNKN